MHGLALCGAPGVTACDGLCGDCVHARLTAPECRRAFAAAAAAHPVGLVVVDTLDDDDLPEPLDPARFVHAVELENRSGLAGLKLSTRLRVDQKTGRATLIVRAEVRQ